MVFAEPLMRLAAGLLAGVQTRVQLVATEVEEEALRYFSFLMLSLAAMFFLGLAILLGALLLVVLYWETHRVGILLALIAVLAGLGIVLGWQVRARYRTKPPLLGDTLTQLSRDHDLLHPSA